MDFEDKKFSFLCGRITGFFVMYFIFTTLLYLILKYLNKLPSDFLYVYMFQFTLFIVLVGVIIKFLLK